MVINQGWEFAVINQGWEFAFWFLEQITRFCERKSEIAIPSFPRSKEQQD